MNVKKILLNYLPGRKTREHLLIKAFESSFEVISADLEKSIEPTHKILITGEISTILSKRAVMSIEDSPDIIRSPSIRKGKNFKIPYT